MGLEPRVVNQGTNLEFMSFPTNFYNTKKSREYSRMKDEVRKLTLVGIEKYVESETKKAELHYESSIKKLTFRIEKKGLKIDNLKVLTSNIGVNINITLTDGEKTVKAFTIIAEGLIQRPHYRYLIK